jgi:hypothetical protein
MEVEIHEESIVKSVVVWILDACKIELAKISVFLLGLGRRGYHETYL